MASKRSWDSRSANHPSWKQCPTLTKTKQGEEEFLLGNPNEPLMLHVPLISRGILGKEYLPGVPLTGPPAGEIFDLRGMGQEQDGQQKLKWDPKERGLFRNWLRNKLEGLPDL